MPIFDTSRALRLLWLLWFFFVACRKEDDAPLVPETPDAKRFEGRYRCRVMSIYRSYTDYSQPTIVTDYGTETLIVSAQADGKTLVIQNVALHYGTSGENADTTTRLQYVDTDQPAYYSRYHDAFFYPAADSFQFIRTKREPEGLTVHTWSGVRVY